MPASKRSALIRRWVSRDALDHRGERLAREAGRPGPGGSRRRRRCAGRRGRRRARPRPAAGRAGGRCARRRRPRAGASTSAPDRVARGGVVGVEVGRAVVALDHRERAAGLAARAAGVRSASTGSARCSSTKQTKTWSNAPARTADRRCRPAMNSTFAGHPRAASASESAERSIDVKRASGLLRASVTRLGADAAAGLEHACSPAG